MGKTIAIVGGGIIGMSIAWRLSQAGFRVTVFERGKIGGESSWAGAGMLAPGGEFDADSPLVRLAMQSRDMYRAFVEELQKQSGFDIDFQETGALDLAYSIEELSLLGERAARQSAIGIPSRRLTTEQIAIFWPRIRMEELAGGYFYPGDASVNPRDVIAALQAACLAQGVNLTEQYAVEHLDARDYAAVVISAGAWSSSIALQGAPDLPRSEPVRGHLIGYRQPDQTCNTIVRHGHTYLLQRANGLLIVGASEERVGFDRHVDQQAANALEKQGAEVMPHLNDTSPSEVWNGFRPGGEGLQLGQWQSSNVFLAYGHYRNGILLAPISAQIITNEISAALKLSR